MSYEHPLSQLPGLPSSLRHARLVGVADMSVSNDPGEVLITHSLGSCLGVAIHDPSTRVGGLLHLMLPSSEIDPRRASTTPSMFVDTGVPLLFRTAYRLGADKARLVVKVAGGAEMMDGRDFFSIGSRNHQALRDLLNRHGVCPHAESVGGRVSRTVALEIGSGALKVHIPGETEFSL